MTYDTIKLIAKLAAFPERQGRYELAARNLILKELKKLKQKYVLQKFTATYPKPVAHRLLVDGQPMASLPTSFVSGQITADRLLLSSLDDSRQNKFYANINANPLCPAISRPNRYFAPSLAVSRDDLERIRRAATVNGYVAVKKASVRSANILVGNIKNPAVIIFSHYDSIGPGAIDNASGVAISLKIIAENPEVLRHALFVIAGNEELSYDKKHYWGHGYRVFEKTYRRLLAKCEQIAVIDCVGYGATKTYRDKHFVELGLPLARITAYASKTVIISGAYDDLLPFYHSNLDTPSRLKPHYLSAAHRLVLKLIRKTKTAS